MYIYVHRCIHVKQMSHCLISLSVSLSLSYPALIKAARTGNVQTVRHLLYHGARADIKDFKGYSAFKRAA